LAIEQFLSVWGLPAVFVFSAAEGEGAAFFGGVMAHRGLFPFESAALAAAAGAFLIDQALFHAGRHAARFAFARRLLSRPSAQSVMQTVRNRPTLFGLSIRFLYGLKTVGTLALGASGLNPLRFALLDFVSAAAWGHIVTGFGYGAGRAIEAVLGKLALHVHLSTALVIAVVLIASAELIRRRL
jgi:membrane protein DedA with SNARE-associated domain